MMIRAGVFAVILSLGVAATEILSNAANIDSIVITNYDSSDNDVNGHISAEIDSSSQWLRDLSAANVTVVKVDNTIHYSVGRRISSDRIVSQNKDSYRWATPTNLILILQYPIKGQGAVVTYVEVIVDQSSNLGRAYVLAGGIGQRYIAVIVEANSTYWFNYSSKIYGV